MNFDNDEDIMKAIMGQDKGKGMDVNDELDALEAELLNEQGKAKKNKDDLDLEDLEKEVDNKPKRKTSDDELAALENEKDYDDELAALEKEGFDDLEEEKPNPKPEKKAEPKPKVQPKPQPKQQPQAQPQKQTPPPKPKPQPEIKKQEIEKPKQKGGIDLYPEKTEKKYHNVEKMDCLTALEKETQICDMIIDYKKKRGDDYDDWEIKKDSIKDKIDIITSKIQNGIWNFEIYKKKIQEQYKFESKLLVFVEKDPNLNEEQKNKLKERVNERKQIIEKELSTNVEEEQEEEQSKQEEEKKDTGNKGIDYYPDKVENKYHSVAKMDSLGVLERELKICDIIIEYKKKINEDYSTWEIKKESIQTKKSTIEGLGMNDNYKKKIKVEYEWESKLLVFVEKDPILNDAQKKILKERVNNRKKILEDELKGKSNTEAKKEEKSKEEE